MKKVQTYTPPEGELLSVFTNWAGDGSTNNLPVSGKAIRELLQDRLLNPFYLYYDQTGKMYRFFRHHDDFTKWYEREDFPDELEERTALELYSFVAPSPYEIKINSYDDPTAVFDNTGRFVRQGVNNDATKLKFRWDIQQDGDVYPDSMLVTYVIKNTSEQREIKRYGPNLKSVIFDLYDYLAPGTNTITINFQGEQSKVTKSIGLTIDVIVLRLSSEFPYSNSFSSNTTYSFKVDLRSTGNMTKTILYYLDNGTAGNLLGGNHVVESQTSNYSTTANLNFGQLSAGYHTLLILAHSTVNGETFCSNLLYYQFVVPENVSSQMDYIVTKYSFENATNLGGISTYAFYADQYRPFTMSWAYVSNSLNANKTDVSWSLVRKSKSDDSEQESFSYPFTAIQKGIEQELSIVPDIATTDDYDCILRATVGLFVYDYPIIVTESSYKVSETSGYVLKLNAIGKLNSDHTWSYRNGGTTYSTTFNNFTWDDKSGWAKKALLVAEHSYATVGFKPFAERTKPIRQFGRTVEIEFEFSSIGDSSEALIKIGDYENGFGIKITPNEASFVYANEEILTTNYKENERIKLAFIVYPQVAHDTNDNALLWIVNNGILERCVANDAVVNPVNEGVILIGNATSKSKTAVYSIRCYDNAISHDEAFNNFAFDSSDINKILERNDVFDDYGNLDYDRVKTKIDTILITGQLDLILNMTGATGDTRKNVQIPVTLQRICLADESYNFIIKNCRIRAHGQSTLNYPIPSFKFWSDSTFNCSVGGAVPNNGIPEEEQIHIGEEYTPVMYHGTDPETDCIDGNIIYKGRYSFKPGAIPAKKWVLQANYADSSCTHNGGIQRLIQSTWYGAKVDNEYVLRSDPQQFATNTGSHKSDGWSHYVSSEDFPYELRNSSDSVPCVVFYRRSKESTPVFVGQFVLMDDKKSDFVYGERSIYNVPKDPFCFLQGNSGKDTDENRIWDNSHVLRLEQTSANNEFASFESLTKDGKSFDGMVGDTYNWEDDFELIYPEKEDITSRINGVKVFDRTKFINRVQPFINFYKWLVATKNSYNQQTDWWAAGIYSTAQQAFEATAADHLDLYKIAAYYIFLLRFGLVDSLERNAQLKTYDGQHWHFEPWDMDIALGNNNQGQITFDPPINRSTRWDDAYAYTGRSTTTSNWLYDALEAWHTVATTVNGNVQYTTGFLGTNSIVTKTAAALYDAGLTYGNVVNMLDNNYSTKWCERIYNFSGHYKYIENGGSDYYTWLQGARTTHRHWWLKSSFDYWDAEWGVGEFLRNSIYLALDATAGQEIRLVPSTETYFGVAFEYTSAISDKQRLLKDVQGIFALRQASTTKKPLYLLGASYIKELDLSDVSDKMSVLNLSGCYDSAIVSSNLKSLNIGIPVANMEAGVYNSRSFIISINTSVDDETGDATEDAGLGIISNVFKEVESFNVLGYTGSTMLTNITKWLGAMENLKDFRSIGSQYTVFPGISARTEYEVLQLPNTVTSITLKNATWQFADALDDNPDTSTGFSVWFKNTNDEFAQVGHTYYAETLRVLNLPGNTGRNKCSYDFVKKIINAYKAVYSNDPTSATYYRTMLGRVTLEIEDVDWSGFDLDVYLTYEDLLDLGSFNGGNPQASPTSFTGSAKIQGYIIMANEGASDGTLTQQFANLQSIFGTSIFDKNSGGLTIDYQRDTIVVTVGTMPQYPSADFSYDGTYYNIQEGYFANGEPYKFPLSATKFMLDTVTREATWVLYRYTGSDWQPVLTNWNGIRLVYSGGQEYLEVPELSNVYGDNITTPQLFKVFVTIEGLSKEAQIKVIPKRYPTGDTITCVEDPDAQTPINIPYESGFVISDYPNTYKIQSTLNYTGSLLDATIDTVEWSMNIPQGCPLLIMEQDSDGLWITLSLTKSLSLGDSFVIPLAHSIKYKNTTFISTTVVIKIQYDPVIITSTGNNLLYQSVVSSRLALTPTWNPLRQYSLKRSEVEATTGTFTTAVGLSSYSCTIDNNTYWLLDYLPNITSFVLGESSAQRFWINTPIYKKPVITESHNEGADLAYTTDNYSEYTQGVIRHSEATLSSINLDVVVDAMSSVSVRLNKHLQLTVPGAEGQQVWLFVQNDVESCIKKLITLPYTLTTEDIAAFGNCSNQNVLGQAILYHTGSGSSSPLNGKKAYLYDNKGLDLHKMPNLTYFSVNGTGNVYASGAMSSLTEMCLGSIEYFDDTNFVALKYLYELRGSRGVANEHSVITDVSFKNCSLETPSKNHRWWNAARLLKYVGSTDQIKSLRIEGATSYVGKFDSSDKDHLITLSGFDKIATIARAAKVNNSTISCTLVGKIYLPTTSLEDIDWFNEHYPDLEISYGVLKLKFEDPYAEALCKMAYAGKNKLQDLPGGLTKLDLGTITAAEAGVNAKYWVEHDFTNPSSVVTLTSENYKKVIVLDVEVPGADVIKSVVHFPEIEYMNASFNGFTTSNTGYSFNNGVLKSVINGGHTLSGGGSANEGQGSGWWTSLLVGYGVKYADYANCSNWFKYGNKSYVNGGVAVFWTEFTYESDVSVPTNTYILIPNTIAKDVYLHLGTSLSDSRRYLTSSHSIYVFDEGIYTRNIYGQLKLWKDVFYNNYNTNNSIADVKRYIANNLPTLANYYTTNYGA